MKNVASHRSPAIHYGAWLLLGILLFFYLSLFKNALIDDAFITLRYVKTLLASGTWGFFPGVVANSATSPLNVLLLSLISLFTGPTIYASLGLYLLCLLGIAFLLVRLSRYVTGSEVYAWLAVCALIFNPLLISTIGLESIVFIALFVLALYSFHLQKWLVLATALGLLTLARADGALFLPLFLLFIPSGKARIRVILVYSLCILPWYLFSWIYLGSFLPDTFFIKTDQAAWFQWDFSNGMVALYFSVYPFETLLAFSFLPLSTLILHQKVRDVPILVITWLAGLIHFVAYSLLKVPPFHWYYVPQVFTIILFGSLGIGVASHSSALWKRRLWGLVAVLAFLIPAFGMSFLLARQWLIVKEMPLHSNWATHEQYKEIGLWLKENQRADTIQLAGSEIGTLSYYCDCRLLDRFSDRSWLREYMIERGSRSGIVTTLLKINFAFYSEPVFSPHEYILRAYATNPRIEGETIKEWEISTKWIPHAWVILARQLSD